MRHSRGKAFQITVPHLGRAEWFCWACLLWVSLLVGLVGLRGFPDSLLGGVVSSMLMGCWMLIIVMLMMLRRYPEKERAERVNETAEAGETGE